MTYLRFFIDLCFSWKFRFRSIIFFDDYNLRRIKRNSLNTSTYKFTQIYHPTKFGCSSFYRFLDLMETGFFFCLGIGNERPKINFEKMKNKLLEVFIFSIILKNFRKFYPAIYEKFCWQKRGKLEVLDSGC